MRIYFVMFTIDGDYEDRFVTASSQERAIEAILAGYSQCQVNIREVKDLGEA